MPTEKKRKKKNKSLNLTHLDLKIQMEEQTLKKSLENFEEQGEILYHVSQCKAKGSAYLVI